VVKALADAHFITECSIPDEPKVENKKPWMLYVEKGSTTNGGTGAGMIIVYPKEHT